MQYENVLNFGMGKSTSADILKWPPVDAVQRDLITTDRVYPIVVGCVDYQSGAMREQHQTGFIFEIEEADSDNPNGPPAFVHYGTDVAVERVRIVPFFFGQGKNY
jgi:glucose-6-phosphate 1-dehydrogenase